MGGGSHGNLVDDGQAKTTGSLLVYACVRGTSVDESYTGPRSGDLITLLEQGLCHQLEEPDGGLKAGSALLKRHSWRELDRLPVRGYSLGAELRVEDWH